MATGLQREGLKAQEVFKIRSDVERMIEEGEEPDIAYAIACRQVIGVTPETFKGWKPDIFKLIKGEKTPADSLLSGALVPEQGKPADSAAFKRIAQLGGELDAAKEDHARIAEELEKLKKQKAAPGKDELDKLKEQLASAQKENEKLKKAAAIE